MIFSLFAMWSFPFFLFCGLFFVIVCFESHYESPFWALATLCVFIIFISAASDALYVFKLWVSGHVKLSIAIGLVYFPVGFVWSVFKWVMYVRDNVKRLTKEYKKGDKKMSVNFETTRAASLREYLLHELPTVAASKKKLVSWITYWPFSMVDFCLSDFVIRISNGIYNLSANLYGKIRESMIPK